MNPQQAYNALRELALTSPKWVGSRVDSERNVIIRGCMRCGGREEREMPLPLDELKQHASVPSGFDEAMFGWMKDFADKHRACIDTKGPAHG